MEAMQEVLKVAWNLHARDMLPLWTLPKRPNPSKPVHAMHQSTPYIYYVSLHCPKTVNHAITLYFRMAWKCVLIHMISLLEWLSRPVGFPNPNHNPSPVSRGSRNPNPNPNPWGAQRRFEGGRCFVQASPATLTPRIIWFTNDDISLPLLLPPHVEYFPLKREDTLNKTGICHMFLVISDSNMYNK